MIRLIVVGKLKSPYYREGVADYERRLGRFAKLECIEIGDKEPESEGKRILTAVKGQPVVVGVVEGEPFSSERMAEFLGREASPCFIIGGPDGISEAVRQRASLRLSLSAMTFPHELARLILLEQLYRGCTILKGHPYHH